MLLRYGHPPGLKANNLLESPQYIGYQMIKGPEAIVFDSNGSIYTGLANGQIVRIDPNGHIEKIVQIGEEMDERICGTF
jgi:hypothetical protein